MPETGFSKIKVIVLVIAVALVAAASAVLLTMKHDNAADNSATASPGTTKSVDSIAHEEASDEDAIDNSFAAQDEDSVNDTDKAADDIGGAYNESDL